MCTHVQWHVRHVALPPLPVWASLSNPALLACSLSGPVGSLVEWEAGHEDGGLGAAGGVSRGRKWVPERANPRPKRQVLANNPGRRGVQGATTGLIGTASAYSECR